MTPAPTHLHLGGVATVSRYREGLQNCGHLCELFGGSGEGALKQSFEGTLGRFRPDIVHAHDAKRCGMQLLGSRNPWVISLSGEDLHCDALHEVHGPMVCEVIRRAHRVLVPSEAAALMVEERVPEAVGKIDVVPRAAVKLPTNGTDLRRSLGIPHHRFVVFLPGGLRPVKGQLRAVAVAEMLRTAGADIEMILAGPDQDEAYASEVRQLCEQQAAIRVMPTLASERMGAAYLDADVVLNTSHSEGSAPTILEAGILGRPVIASDVPGNRELIRHKETGLLYQTEEEMAKQILALYRNRAAAGALGVRIQEDFSRRFAADSEIRALLSAYAAA